jgi:hypothetical protein
MNQHLEMDQIAALAEQALGIADAAFALDLGYDAFVHLMDCDECRQTFAELTAALVGQPLEGSLDHYRVVPFVPSITPAHLEEPEVEDLLAAEDEDLGSSLPAMQQRRVLLSADGEVELRIAERPADDSCRIYPFARGTEVDPTSVTFYLPPGVVRPWPQGAAGNFRYPRYAYDAVDWPAEIKLLYPIETAELGTPEGEPPGARAPDPS